MEQILMALARLGKATTGRKISNLNGITNYKAAIAWIGRVFNHSKVDGAGFNAGMEVLRMFK